MAAESHFHPPSSILHPRVAESHPLLPPGLVVIAGPTAVGKSEVALLLAEKLGGEIISVDSMQVYRGLDIGTAKPSLTERARVPHHLIDVVEVNEPFDAAQFVGRARRAVSAIRSRDRVPILCGGTGLYFKAFLEGLGEAPAADKTLRLELEATPLEGLLRELAERDPATYERIDRQNPRRVIRAVEVIRLTGRVASAQRAQWQPAAADSQDTPESACRPDAATHLSPLCPRPSPLAFGLSRPPEDLRRRLELRVDEMFRRGLVAETEQLLQRGLAGNRNAMQALGYRQAAEHLRGERSLTETVKLVKSRTRQFAKRQMTWFRRQLQLTWIQIEPGEDARTVADRLAGHIRAPGGG